MWVLNEKALIPFIDHELETFDRRQQRVLAEALARYVRDHDAA